MSLPAKSKYGYLSWTESLGMAAALIPIPVLLLWNVATTANASYNKERSLKRIVGDSALRYIFTRLSIPQLQRGFGTTWAQDSRLLWIGPKRLERVILFLHGGGFLLPATDAAMSFWRYVQLELERQNIEVGVALLNYCTYADSLSPLRMNSSSYSTVADSILPHPAQAGGLALDFLMAAGSSPRTSSSQVTRREGTSSCRSSRRYSTRASRPRDPLPAPLRGAYIISPWMNLSADSKSHTENDGRDIVSPGTFTAWGAQILADVPETDRAFAEPVRAPEWWFKGADALVERVLITAGGAELLRDDIVAVGEAFKKHHPNAEVVVQKDGLHDDMYLDFMLKEKKLSSLTPLTVEWLAAGFTT
ncbi:hypothetical protein B0H13DRAFT_2301943 [Mycena leptocephala]|nr:hypothetical protein B0H13DRAFT_2301943 [Mycena leptocephala]